MSTLIRLELRRFWARKLVRNGTVILTAIIIVFGGAQLFTHSPEEPSSEGLADEIAREVEQCRGWALQEWESISAGASDEAEFDAYLSQFETAEEWADEQCNPNHFGGYIPELRFCYASLWSETYTNTHFCPDVDEAALLGAEFEGSFRLEEQHRDQSTVIEGRTYRLPNEPNMGAVVATSTSLLIVAIVLGASFVGAEYRAGTIENQLLWEPRRIRIAAAKFVAVSGSAALLHLGALTTMMISVVPAAAFAGTFAGTDNQFWGGVAATIVRGSISAGLVAAASAALALIVRNTAGSVGVMMGYGIVGTGLLFWLAPSLTRWEIATNSGAFVSGGDVSQYLGDQYPRVFSHSPWVAGLIVLLYTAALVAVATAVFNRRDIN